MLGDILLDELQKHVGHFEALRCDCGLEAAVKLCGNIDIQSFYPDSFLRLDLTHLLSSEDEHMRL